jgi:hypothetical protein
VDTTGTLAGSGAYVTTRHPAEAPRRQSGSAPNSKNIPVHLRQNYRATAHISVEWPGGHSCIDMTRFFRSAAMSISNGHDHRWET